MDQWTRFAHTQTHTTERTALADGRETLHLSVFSAEVLHVGPSQASSAHVYSIYINVERRSHALLTSSLAFSSPLTVVRPKGDSCERMMWFDVLVDTHPADVSGWCPHRIAGNANTIHDVIFAGLQMWCIATMQCWWDDWDEESNSRCLKWSVICSLQRHLERSYQK